MADRVPSAGSISIGDISAAPPVWRVGSAEARIACCRCPPQFDPAASAESLQISTPFVLSLAPVLGSLSIIAQAGIEALRARSLRLNRLLIDLFNARLARRGHDVDHSCARTNDAAATCRSLIPRPRHSAVDCTRPR